ncbi:MAG: glycerate kinase, partial [Phycisphaerae bacterium]|nr:glycerate kinase [Phycisphaerae bacterium]MDW8263499.1 glycerate kinase [Phycisphaerales bacterium]
MRIVVAPDKFKGCLTAAQVASAIAQGVRRAVPEAEVEAFPMSDGGEGFVDALINATGGRRIRRRVVGPVPEMQVDAVFGVIDGPVRQAVIEMSAASGLALLPPGQRDPMRTTTFGTGQLLLAAVEEGCRQILLGLGGSATIDGGIGCCQAAGLPVILSDGECACLSEPLCGSDLGRVVLIKSHRGERLAGLPITVACDVTNPLFGENGAAAVYGP